MPPGTPNPEWSKCELPPPAELGEPADWARVYGRPGPLIVEIGCGGGRTIIGMAVAHPEWNFLAIERAGEYYRTLRERVTKRGLANMRVTQLDAAYLINRFFPDASVREYHVYFPDPWPKKRHHKRRLFTEQFCADLRRTLIPGGVLYFATDHQDYYQEILPRLRAALSVQEHPEPWEDAPEGRTNYEVKYLREARPIYRLVGTT
ncbi:MAG: tRNA (guanosine(46)-N7)-methyltransferase TrmB [Planctomycetota bacterium]|nr:tRNA (guanosine(46)-N7)-methyltransferase TrmB [Planctomycetota bacterium]